MRRVSGAMPSPHRTCFILSGVSLKKLEPIRVSFLIIHQERGYSSCQLSLLSPGVCPVSSFLKWGQKPLLPSEVRFFTW